MSVSDSLHSHERKILLALKELGPSSPSKIARKSGLPEASVHKAGQWLSLKGLVERKESVKEEFFLTEEGKRYLKEGLPEKNLIRALAKGPLRIESLKIENPQVAISWAKKNGWINIRNGTIELTPEGESALNTETDAEKTLAGRSRAAIKELSRRKLIETKERKTIMLSLTAKGMRAARALKPEAEETGQLTPEMLRTGTWKKARFRPYNLNTPVPVAHSAKLHPYTQFIRKTKIKLISLGFREVSGPYVETEFWNSDALFMPQDHPARGIHDTFRIKTKKKGRVENKLALERVAKTHLNGWITGSSGWGTWDQDKTLSLILRSQTTAVSARTLAGSPEIPGKYFTISRSFRPDEIDATHFVEFHQLDGIVLGENLTFRHLLGYLDMFGREIAEAEKTRFRPSYFPFTEPSVEIDCMINGKWVEVGGAGMLRPEVTLPLGVNVPVLAWGFGFERLSMIKLGVSDIRLLYNDDLEWLRTKEVVR